MNWILNEPYDNQVDVDKVKAIIADISPGLLPTGYYLTSDCKNVTCVIVQLLVKGNKDVIAKLVSVGFEKGKKRKVETGRDWGMYEGYSFKIDLKYHLEARWKGVQHG